MLIIILLSYTGFTESVNSKILNRIEFRNNYIKTKYLEFVNVNRKVDVNFIENSLKLNNTRNSNYSVNQESKYKPNWGTYTAELMGAAILFTGNIAGIVYNELYNPWNFVDEKYLWRYIGLNTLLAPVGNIIGEGVFTYFSEGESRMSGDIWKSLLGAAVGSIAGWSMYHWSYYNGNDIVILYSFWFILPPLGATIGYNL